MKRTLTSWIATAALLAVALPVAARDGRVAIPAHPSELKYGKLDFEVPEAKGYRHTLKNGIPVFIAEDRSLPLVDVGVRVRIGDFLEDDDTQGVAGMTGTLMRVGGAGEMSAEEFDERVDFLAANMGAFIGATSGGASMDCFSGVLDECLDMFFMMMREPRFDGARLQVEKDDLLESMKQRNDSPQSIASREWQWLMRGRDHFTSAYMTKAQVDAISREELAAFHEKYWRPNHMILTVSGDVDTQAILDKLNAKFEGWEAGKADVPWPPPAPKHEPRPGVYYVEKDIPQGRVQIGHLGYQRKDWGDPKEFALDIMNDILGGGGFTSRITNRIRSDEGLAYSAGSQFGTSQYWPGTFAAGFQTKSATVALASKIAIEEITRIRSEPVTDDELKVAKNSLIDSFPRRFESAAQIVGTFAADEYDDRPSSYWKKYRDRVEAVTAKDVQKAAKEQLAPDKLVMLIVGKWDDVEKGDPDGRATMAEFTDKPVELPLRDPMTLKPIEQATGDN